MCSTCGHENTADAKFCNQCATPLIAPISDPAQSRQQESEFETRFQTQLLAVIYLLQRERRVTYRTLKHTLGVGDSVVMEIFEELCLRHLAIDEEGKVLVWTGESPTNISPTMADQSRPASVDTAETLSPVVSAAPSLATPLATPTIGPTNYSEDLPPEGIPDEPDVVPKPTCNVPEAERRQLTVMFCDLVGSTDLSGKLDPEDLREVVRAYQETAAEVIQKYEGHIAQYLGDGLLIYFGWPQAHENDAERAVYTGLEIPQAVDELNCRLEMDYGLQLAVRIGIHTGPVVVGEIGSGEHHEDLALGKTPNIAARLEGVARPNTVVISSVTAQLAARSFVLEELGLHSLKRGRTHASVFRDRTSRG